MVLNPDSDSDGKPDYLDPDSDSDGIPDYLDPDAIATGGVTTWCPPLGPGALFTRARDVQTGLPGESELRGSRLAQQLYTEKYNEKLAP